MFDEATAHVDDGSSWREAHRQLQRIARRRKTLDVEEARWLLIARSQRVHEQLGFGSFLEYMERILDYAPRTALERLRVAEELEQLPETRDRLATGELSYSAVRAITRTATSETEHAWLDQAQSKSMREIEALFRGRRKGDTPSDLPDPAIEPRRWTVDLERDVYAAMLEARRRLEEELGGRLDDSAFVAALCERAIADRAGVGCGSDRPPFQVALTLCERCDRATQDGAGHIVEVAPRVVAQARCDAEYIGHLDAETPARLTTEIPLATRRLIFRRDHGC
jgi:hypothetical protein